MNDNDEDIALYFSAKQENSELKAKIERLEANMNSIVVEMGKMENYRQILDSNIIDRDISIDKLKSFINLLDDYPMFWGMSYKRSIRQFLDINFPEK